jgi:hypothetical protein
LKETPIIFAPVLLLYSNNGSLNIQGRLHQQPRKDPVNRLNITFNEIGSTLIEYSGQQCGTVPAKINGSNYFNKV